MPRSQLVSLDATPNYHCVSRYVRRQYLCGFDAQTGRDFSHRRDWIRARVCKLAKVFAIGVYANAVMSNHCHLVLSVDQECALTWDEREVVRRWMKLFGGLPLVQSFAAGETLSEAQLAAVALKVDVYRRRLFDFCWFMRWEPIARMANAEDNATGRFWKGSSRASHCLRGGAVRGDGQSRAQSNPGRNSSDA